jgi:hypothetical protein
LKCDENGQNITEKRMNKSISLFNFYLSNFKFIVELTNIKIKPKKKSNNKVAFRCNKCFFEWSANEKVFKLLKILYYC